MNSPPNYYYQTIETKGGEKRSISIPKLFPTARILQHSLVKSKVLQYQKRNHVFMTLLVTNYFFTAHK